MSTPKSLPNGSHDPRVNPHTAASSDGTRVVFTSPRALPEVGQLPGRVAVLDVAFAADGMGTSFAGITLRFIRELGSRLAAWVDHHDHESHVDFKSDPRFILSTKAEHGACPEMVTPEIVRAAGPVGTIVCHLDVDGLYAAAKWLRGGSEPYPGADADARVIDTRVGTPGPIADRIDRALRAHFRDESLKHRVVRYLVAGARDAEHELVIAQAAADFDTMEAETQRLTGLYERRGRAVYVDAQRAAKSAYDKTQLLLNGQTLAEVAIVRDAGSITAAAAFDSGIDFIRLLKLGGGMPTRVSLPEKRLAELLQRLNEALP